MSNGDVPNRHRPWPCRGDWDSISARVEEDALNVWALRALVRRGRSQWGLLTVVAAVSLLACTMMSGLTLTYGATRDYGLGTTLASLSGTESEVVVSLDQGNGQTYAPAAQAVADALDTTLQVPILGRTETITSEWVNPSTPIDTGTWLYFAHLDGVEAQVRVVTGRLPRPDERVTRSEVAVAVPRSYAAGAHLRVGSRLPVVETSTTSTATAIVVGIYEIRPTLRSEGFWDTDALEGATTARIPAPGSGGTFLVTAHGPLLVAREGFTAGPLHPSRAVITATPDLSGLSPATLGPFQKRVAGLSDSVPRLLDASIVLQALPSTRLAASLDTAHRTLVVTTAGLLITGSLLLILAVAALLLATRLLAERRSTEQTLMRARGASGLQLARLAAAEAAVLALVTGVAAPLLARPLYLAVAHTDLFVDAGLDRDPGLPVAVWVVAAGTAVALVTVLLVPLLRRAGTFVEQEQAAARQDRRSVIQRSGIDAGLVLLAALGYWQLLRYSTPLAAGDDGPSVDPLLVAGPGLVLLAGGLLSVRAIPVLSRRLEQAAARGPGVVWPLASWEVGRRARRSVGAVLLLSLAIATGTFSLAYLDTWQTSRVDQADAAVGADAVIDLSAAGQPGGQAAQLRRAVAESGADVSAVMPVLARDAGLSIAGDADALGPSTTLAYGVPVQLLGVDSATAASLVRGRTGMPGGDARRLVRALPELTPSAASGLPLPDGTTRIRVDLRATGRHLPGRLIVTTALVVEDGAGVRTRIPLGSLPADAARRTLTATLPQPVAPAAGAAGRAPRIVALQAQWAFDGNFSVEVDSAPEGALTVLGMAAGTPQRLTALSLAPLRGAELVGEGIAESTMEVRDVPLDDAVVEGLVIEAALVPDSRQGFRYSTMTSTAVGWPARAEVPVVVTPAALARLGLKVGAEVALVIDQAAVPVTVVGTTPLVPGTDGRREAVIVDADALSRRLVEYGLDGPTANRWWVDVPDTDVPALSAAVTKAGGTVTSAWQRARDAGRAPLAVGLHAAQWLVVLAAAVLAGIGFALNTAVAIRLRRIEFAQMLAVGVRRKDLERVIAAETVLLWAVGAGCGLVLGLLLTRTLTPLVAMSAPGGIPIPAVRITLPWLHLAALLVAVAVVLALVVAGVARTLRQSVLGAVLRLGDER